MSLSAGPAEGSLNDIVERLLKLVDEENTERSEPHLNHEASSIRLSELFDFRVEYWMGMAEMTGCRGLQDEPRDELEFYELLDLDGSGEQDTDTTVDSMSEAVLMSNWAVVLSGILRTIHISS